jgi:galactokinase
LEAIAMTSSTDLSRAEEGARNAYQRHFGRPPRWIASAPGRVNLIGEFTDYNGGFVLPMAIEARTAIAAAPNESSRIVLHSQSAGETTTIDLSRPLMREIRGRWTNYVRGVVAGFLQAGIKPQGFDALIRSDVPLGSGLSSSAALETSAATLLEAVTGVTLDPLRKVLLCQSAEHSYACVPCGIMDPYISSLGRAGYAMLLDCRSNEPTWLALDDPGVAVLVINTNVKHQLAESEYALRRKACEEAARVLDVSSLREASMELLVRRSGEMAENAMRCARHVIGEIARTERAAACISLRDWSEFGRLLDASHDSLREDFQVSCEELDAVVAAARDIGRPGGVYGARLTGGGFGGCVIALIEATKRLEIEREIGAAYLRATGIQATMFVSRPASGASVIEL